MGWEYRHLQRADVVMYWFPASAEPTVQPIALFELGAVTVEACHGMRRLVVGADGHYTRRPDVELQLRLRCPELVVHGSLPDTVRAALAAALGPASEALVGSSPD